MNNVGDIFKKGNLVERIHDPHQRETFYLVLTDFVRSDEHPDEIWDGWVFDFAKNVVRIRHVFKRNLTLYKLAE